MSYTKLFLVDKLSVKRVNKLLKWNHKHPKKGELLFYQLCNEVYFSDLTYECIHYLNEVFDCGYEPSDISKLFKGVKC